MTLVCILGRRSLQDGQTQDTSEEKKCNAFHAESIHIWKDLFFWSEISSRASILLTQHMYLRGGAVVVKDKCTPPCASTDVGANR